MTQRTDEQPESDLRRSSSELLLVQFFVGFWSDVGPGQLLAVIFCNQTGILVMHERFLRCYTLDARYERLQEYLNKVE